MIGLHFVRHAVEIVKGKLTSEATYYTVQAFIDKLKVFSARVKEAPGYVFDRLILSFFNEAVNVLAEGLTTAEELDELIKTAFSWRIGPLEMADRIGLDEILYKLEELYHVTRNVKYLPSTYLQNLVAQGKLGIRVQEGFFKYSAEGKRIHKVEVDTYKHTRH